LVALDVHLVLGSPVLMVIFTRSGEVNW